MYFLIVVALIGGVPQTLAAAVKDLPTCLEKRKEIEVIVTSDPSVQFYSVDCVKGFEPRKAM
jgi:hypothetical protein